MRRLRRSRRFGLSTTLGRLLQSAREELGYSRTRAAELSGVNASTIEAWEVGRVLKPPFQDVVRLARVLSISMSELERCVMEEQDGEGIGRRQSAGTRELWQRRRRRQRDLWACAASASYRGAWLG